MRRRKNYIKMLLFRVLNFENYLLLLSKFYFFSYAIGLLKFSKSYVWHFFLKHIIHPGNTVIDIGANLGYYTVLFSKWVGPQGKVFAVEPVPPVFNVLRKNVQGLKNIVLHNLALGDENKKISMANNSKMHYGYVTSGTHFVHTETQTDNTMILFDAEMQRGSALFQNLTKIDFIKCDVEGFELVILKDMQGIIENHKPNMLIETGGDNRKKVISLLEKMGYNGFTLNNNVLIAITENNLSGPDILFIHESKNANFAEHMQ